MTSTEKIFERATADLQQAEAEAGTVRARLAELQSEISDLQAFVRTFNRYATLILPPPVDQGRADSHSRIEHAENTSKSVLREGTIGRTLVDTVIAYIRARGEPQPIGSLLDWVLSQNLTVGGADQRSNLAGYLSRDPRLKSLGRSVGWTVVDDMDTFLQRPQGAGSASTGPDPILNPERVFPKPSEEPLGYSNDTTARCAKSADRNLEEAIYDASDVEDSVSK